MFTLIIGGSGSGKSEYAEQWVTSRPGRRIYIAAMQPWDEECLARIAKHRRARAGRGFETVERYTDLGGLTVPAGSNVLLECLSNLTANEMYAPEGRGADAVTEGVLRLLPQCGDLTVVTNEVFSGGSCYADDTLRYLRALARINRELAAAADCVVEVVCGCPVFWKGSLK